jgi:hypothetical protein
MHQYVITASYLDTFEEITGIPSELEGDIYGSFIAKDPHLAARKAVKSIYTYLKKYYDHSPSHIYVVIAKRGDQRGRPYMGFIEEKSQSVSFQVSKDRDFGKLIDLNYNTRAILIPKSLIDLWGRDELPDLVYDRYLKRSDVARSKDFRQNLRNLD